MTRIPIKDQDDVLSLISAGKKAEAIAFLVDKVRKTQSEYIKATDSLAAYQKALVETDAKQANDETARGKIIIGAVSALALLLAVIIGFWITRSITRPLAASVDAANRMTEGDLTLDLKADSKDETGQLSAAIMKVAQTLSGLTAEMNRMSDEHNEGDIDVIMPVEKFKGAYRGMAQGVNDMVNGHIAVKKKAMACIAEFGKGNFEAPGEVPRQEGLHQRHHRNRARQPERLDRRDEPHVRGTQQGGH